MQEYRDAVTGYTIRRYTEGPERNAKLYFTSENFSVDDRWFFFNRQQLPGRDDGGTWRCDWRSGTLDRVTDYSCSGFALDRFQNTAYVCKNGTEVYAVDLETKEQTFRGNLPRGGQVTGHLTAADTGRIACSYHLANKIYALVILDPGKTEAEVVYESDFRLGHAQICPTDENLIFYIHETEGDAFQRTWMCDVKERYVRPYYVEHPAEWITHEVWAADGSEMAMSSIHPDSRTGRRVSFTPETSSSETGTDVILTWRRPASSCFTPASAGTGNGCVRIESAISVSTCRRGSS